MAWLRGWLSGVLRGSGSTTLESLGVKEITDIEELNAALEEARCGVTALFKHSTRCPISAAAYRQVAGYLEKAGPSAPPMYLIKVIESRAVSNEIAARLAVPHQSPQLILLRDGRPCWNASHGGITAQAIAEAAANVSA